MFIIKYLKCHLIGKQMAVGSPTSREDDEDEEEVRGRGSELWSPTFLSEHAFRSIFLL